MPVIERVWTSGKRKVKRTAWGYTVQIGGKQVRHFDAAWSKEDAQNALAARIVDRDAPAPVPVATITLKQATERYLLEKEANRKRSIRADRRYVKQLLSFFGDSTPLSAITTGRIGEYRIHRMMMVSERTRRQLTPDSVNLELSMLRGLLNLASEEWGCLDRVPRVRMNPHREGRLRYLSDDEAKRLLAECRRAGEHPEPRRSPELYAVVVVALNTGMRLAEVLGLEWPRVDFARGVIWLEKTKTDRRREIPMSRDAYNVLTAFRRGQSMGRVFRSRSIRTAFEGACERAGVKDFHFHDLRHTFASWLTMAGRPLKEVQELLGHSSITMTERYAHLAPERLRDAISALDRRFSTTSAHEAVEDVVEAATAR
jgi:integrase